LVILSIILKKEIALMSETINPEDNLNNGPASVPPFPGSGLDRLNKVEIKTDNLLQDINIIKTEIIENSKAIDHLTLSVDTLEKTMDNRFAAMEKTMDNRFAAMEKTMDNRFAAMEKLMDNRFAAMEKLMDTKFAAQDVKFAAQDVKFAALEKIIDTRFVALDVKFTTLDNGLSSIKNWIRGFVIACGSGLIILFIKFVFFP
jgi:hypothetical protein